MNGRSLFISCLYCLFLVVSFVFLFHPLSARAAVVASDSDAPAWEDAEEMELPDISTPSDVLPHRVRPLRDSLEMLAVGGDHLVNCVRFDVSISGDSYVLLLPSVYESSVIVDDSGYLWNMSASTVQGRLFQGNFDPTADTGYLLYMEPALGNNFSANRNYGSPNSVRRYYWSSSNRLTYDTDYVVVQVEGTHFLFKSSDTLIYVLVFLVGCCMVVLWKKSV